MGITRELWTQDKPVFFFGYGALMFPDGINSHEMEHVYEWKDLSPVILEKHTRGFYTIYKNKRYIGIKPDVAPGWQSSIVSGVAFKLFSPRDLKTLLIGLSAYNSWDKTNIERKVEQKLYFPADVTNNIKGELLPASKTVLTVISYADNGIGQFPLDVQYTKYIWQGIQFWGEDFMQRYVNTGGMKV